MGSVSSTSRRRVYPGVRVTAASGSQKELEDGDQTGRQGVGRQQGQETAGHRRRGQEIPPRQGTSNGAADQGEHASPTAKPLPAPQRTRSPRGKPLTGMGLYRPAPQGTRLSPRSVRDILSHIHGSGRAPLPTLRR